MADDIVNPIGGGNPASPSKLDQYKAGDMASVYGGDQDLRRYFKGEECQVYGDPDINNMCVVVLFPYVADPKDQYKVHVKQLRRRARVALSDIWVKESDFERLKTATTDVISVSASHADRGQGWVRFNQKTDVFKEVSYDAPADDIVKPIG